MVLNPSIALAECKRDGVSLIKWFPISSLTTRLSQSELGLSSMILKTTPNYASVTVNQEQVCGIKPCLATATSELPYALRIYSFTGGPNEYFCLSIERV